MSSLGIAASSLGIGIIGCQTVSGFKRRRLGAPRLGFLVVSALAGPSVVAWANNLKLGADLGSSNLGAGDYCSSAAATTFSKSEWGV